jgi:histone H3/H4
MSAQKKAIVQPKAAVQVSSKEAELTRIFNVAAKVQAKFKAVPAVQPKPKVQKHRVLRDNIQGIKAPQIKRLMLIAGVTSSSSLMYDETRGVVSVLLNDVLRNVATIIEHYRKKKVNGNAVETALEVMGVQLCVGWKCDGVGNDKHLPTSEKMSPWGNDRENAKRKGHAGSKTKFKIRYMQRNSDLAVFDFLSFNRFCREVMQDYVDDILFSPRAIEMLRFYVETTLIQYYKAAYQIVRGEKRKELTPREFQLARSIVRL